MIYDHRQQLIETRFAGEIDWQPRPTFLARALREIAALAVLILAGAVLITWITL